MRTPTLVSGSINRPLGRFPNLGIFDTVSFSVRGGTEYSLQHVANAFVHFRPLASKQVQINLNNRPFQLRGFATMTPFEFEGYAETVIEHLGLVADPKHKTFALGASDFWWDVDNDVFLSFDRQFMNRIPVILPVTIRQGTNLEGV